jgi:cytoskeletal protein CcmA (bactofilin family)
MRVPARALSVFCPHCQKRASLEDLVVTGSHPAKLLTTCGDIRIEPSARLHVEIHGKRVTVLGKVRGPVNALESVEVGPTGYVIGDIKAPRIVVRDGGQIEGRCEMTRPVPKLAVTNPPAPQQELSTPVEQHPATSQEASIETHQVPRPRPLAPPRTSRPESVSHGSDQQ